MKRIWWKEAVIYQIYPRSFKDTNGDGIGDLRGVIQKLNYLKDLGIDVIWLSPFNKSPNDDNGYDISDYLSIMDEFGTMEDFEELLKEAHNRGIRIVMDLVVNHTSDEHPWFIESRSSKDNPKRDWYIWRAPKDGKEPNNWGSFFTPSAWEYDKDSGEYYLHLFSKKQPDLKWENPDVRQEIQKMMRWWLNKGIDGFRMDVMNAYKKPVGLPDSKLPPSSPDGYSFDMKLYFNNLGLVDFLQELNKEVLSGYDVMTVGEAPVVTPEMALEYVAEQQEALNMVFNFEIMDLGENWSLKKIKELQRKWYKTLWGKGWNSQYLSNHDQPRSVSAFGDDKEYRTESAKMLATMIHTMPGTPYIYQGDEIGMTNSIFPTIDSYNDISTRFQYEELIKNGKTKEEALNWLNRRSRENARTPMQWNDNYYAGFTYGKPWLAVNPNYREINVELQILDDNSIYHHYRKLIQLRKSHPVMIYGDMVELFKEHEKAYVYMRVLEDEKWLILINFSKELVELELDCKLEDKKILLSNYKDICIEGTKMTLRAYEAEIIRLV